MEHFSGRQKHNVQKPKSTFIKQARLQNNLSNVFFNRRATGLHKEDKFAYVSALCTGCD